MTYVQFQNETKKVGAVRYQNIKGVTTFFNKAGEIVAEWYAMSSKGIIYS